MSPVLTRGVLQHAAEDVQEGCGALLRHGPHQLLLLVGVRHGWRVLHVGHRLLFSGGLLILTVQLISGLHHGFGWPLPPRGQLFRHQFFWLHSHKFCQRDFLTQNTMEEPLVFGVLEVEHDAAVFALVAVICDLEQVKHLLLNVEGDFSYFAFCHD